MNKEVKPCACCLGSGKEQDPRKVGEAMRKKRVKAGLTLKDISTKMGVSLSHVCYLEQGRRNWNLELKQDYLEALK